MSDREALRLFLLQPVSRDMVDFLAATTALVIQIRQQKHDTQRPVPLTHFILRLVEHSNVQTPTLMALLVFLNRLRNVLPGNAVGMETTRHRIFLASLILAAKALNDLSPMNKHWTRYTDGLMCNAEVNSAERELIALLQWDVAVKENELITVLQPFLSGIVRDLRRSDQVSMARNAYRLSGFYSSSLLALRLLLASLLSLKLGRNTPLTPYGYERERERVPLAEKSSAALNQLRA